MGGRYIEINIFVFVTLEILKTFENLRHDNFFKIFGVGIRIGIVRYQSIGYWILGAHLGIVLTLSNRRAPT